MGRTHRLGAAFELNHIRPESSLSGLLHVRASVIGDITDEERQSGLRHLAELRAQLHRSDEQAHLRRRINELHAEIQKLTTRLEALSRGGAGSDPLAASGSDDGAEHIQQQARDAQQHDERDSDTSHR